MKDQHKHLLAEMGQRSEEVGLRAGQSKRHINWATMVLRPKVNLKISLIILFYNVFTVSYAREKSFVKVLNRNYVFSLPQPLYDLLREKNDHPTQMMGVTN